MSFAFWWNKYVGIPYRPMGCSMDGCDCWGLVRLVYKNEFGIDIPGVTIDMTDHANMELIPMGLDAMWDKTDNPKPGDVINFHVLGHDSHVGIVTAPGQMLHVYDNGHSSCIEVYTSRKWKSRIAGIFTYAHTEQLIPTSAEGVSIIGKPHPLKPRITTLVPSGQSLEEIVMKMCDEMNISPYLRNNGAACVNLVYIPREKWATTYPRSGDTVIFRMRGVAGGGGGFFKSILGVAMIVAAAALTWWAGGAGAAAVGGLLGVSTATAGAIMAVTSLGLTVAGMALLNNSKAAKPSIGVSDVGNFVDAKFLGGGNNSNRVYETIPQVLGIGRMTFDYLGKPYTEQADSYTNYLRVMFTAGYGPVEITDIRNGDTAISEYNDVQYNVYTGWGDDQTPSIYTQDAEEENINVTLGKNEENTRLTAENVDQIQVVLYWPQGLWYRNERGDKCNITSTGNIKFRPVGGSDEWSFFNKVVRPKTLRFGEVSPMGKVTVVRDDEAMREWYERYGTYKYLTAKRYQYTVYQWHTVTIDPQTGNIRSYAGALTDRKNEDASSEFWQYLTRTTWNFYTGAQKSDPHLAAVPENELLLAYVCVQGKSVITIDDRREESEITGCAVTKVSGYPGIKIASGSVPYSGATTWEITHNNEMRAFTRVFTFDVERGQYEICVELTSADAEEIATWSGQAAAQVQWLVMRTFTFVNPFTPRKPLAWLEMRIRATDQINGNLDEINGHVASIVLDYDHETKTWVRRVSNNPASLFRHVLQGPAIADEYRVDDAHLDIKKLEDWHNYCRMQGFTYFKVVGADSSLSVYELLVEIAAAGYAKPILKPEDGGIWSVWVDEPQTTIMQHFTEHNTWGVQWTKNNVNIPHAIRATFVNEEKGYEQDTVTVYVDGHDESTATRFENWDNSYFKGVTNIKQVQRICRRAMAFAKLRPETLSFMCAMEHVTSQMGDLVRVTNSFVQWGLGSGWITKVIKNSSGAAIGLRLSDSVTKTAGTEYSIRVRKAAAKGTSFKADIPASTVSEQVTEIRFSEPVPSGYPEEGDLYQFGYKGKESHECLILSIVPESGDVARITVCDYSPELYDIDDGPLPEYDAGISRPQDLPGSVITALPVFVRAMSDEQVLLVGSDGTLTPRLAIVWKRPNPCEATVTYIQFRYRISKNGIPSGVPDDEGVSTATATMEAGEWMVCDAIPIQMTTMFIMPVTELYKYDVEARFLTTSGVAGQWKRMVTEHKVIGKTSLPPTVKNFKATIASPLGILLTWDKLNIVDISRYKITGDAAAETTDNQITVQVKNKVGELQFLLRAVDTGGRMSEDAAEASVIVYAPKMPSGFASDTRTDGLYLVWDNCDTTWPIQNYIITDDYLNRQTKELRTQTVISPRPVETYTIHVQAVDIFGNKSPIADYGLTIEPPAQPEPTVEIANGVVRLTWKAVTSSFPIKKYQIYSVDGHLLQETNSTFFDVNGPAGILEYRIRAVDTAGNMSTFGEVYLELTPPEPPEVVVKLNKNRDGLDISWTVPDSMLPVVTYDVVRQWDDTLDGDVVETREEDYGSTDSTALSVSPVLANTHTFMVRAVDASGNRSVWGTFDLAVLPPGAAFMTDVNVIDNNVMIYWQEPTEQFFAVSHYNFGTVEDEYFSLIGRIDARFASRFEKQAGSFTYQICPVDVAGNVGKCSTITAQVAQPPDFIFYDDYDSLFNGDRVNASLDGRGNMIIPVYDDATWQENIDRVAGLLQTDASTLTWKQKTDNGYLYFQSPPAPYGTYTEIVDIGTPISSTNITVTVSSTAIEGSPAITCKIEVSMDKEEWRTVADGAFSSFATSFRYVRYTFTVKGGMLAISNINYRLDAKKQSDYGSLFCSKDENGEGFVSEDETPDLYGKWVPFNVAFTDVQSGPMAVCNEPGKYAYISFKDTVQPKGFRVFVLDRDGVRVDGQVSWSAHGV